MGEFIQGLRHTDRDCTKMIPIDGGRSRRENMGCEQNGKFEIISGTISARVDILASKGKNFLLQKS